MPWQILVELKGSNTPIYSPEFLTREEAESELGKVKTAIVSHRAPDVSWMAASGRNILAAHVFEAAGVGIA